MSDKEAFTCPFCGAPHRTLIPAGAVQVNCAFCKSIILVSPRLGGAVRRCPNHSDVLAVGLCNDCGKSHRDRCLYIHEVKDGILHVCHECYRKRREEQETGILFVVGIMGTLLLLIASTIASILKPDSTVWILLFLGGGCLAAIPVIVRAHRKHEPTKCTRFKANPKKLIMAHTLFASKAIEK